jgi:hypothetical protein
LLDPQKPEEEVRSLLFGSHYWSGLPNDRLWIGGDYTWAQRPHIARFYLPNYP